MQILTVEITNYISLSKSMSLRDTLAENERAASEPLIFVMVAIAARETLTNTPLLFCFSFYHSRSQKWYSQCYEKFGCRFGIY